MNLSRYNKFIVALLGAAVLFAQQYFGSDTDWVATVISVLTALGVYQVPNKE